MISRYQSDGSSVGRTVCVLVLLMLDGLVLLDQRIGRSGDPLVSPTLLELFSLQPKHGSSAERHTLAGARRILHCQRDLQGPKPFTSADERGCLAADHL